MGFLAITLALLAGLIVFIFVMDIGSLWVERAPR